MSFHTFSCLLSLPPFCFFHKSSGHRRRWSVSPPPSFLVLLLPPPAPLFLLLPAFLDLVGGLGVSKLGAEVLAEEVAVVSTAQQVVAESAADARESAYSRIHSIGRGT